MRYLLLPLLALSALMLLLACPSEPADDDDSAAVNDDDSVVEDDDDSVVPDDDDSVVPDDDDSVVPDDDDSGCEEVRVCGWDAKIEMFACGGTDPAPADAPGCDEDWTAECGPTTGDTSCCDDKGNLHYCYYESGDIHTSVEECPLDCI